MSGPLPPFQIDLLMVAERMERASRAAPPLRRNAAGEEEEEGEGSRRDTAVEVLEDGGEEEKDGSRSVVRTGSGEYTNQRVHLRSRHRLREQVTYVYFLNATLILKARQSQGTSNITPLTRNLL